MRVLLRMFTSPIGNFITGTSDCGRTAIRLPVSKLLRNKDFGMGTSGARSFILPAPRNHLGCVRFCVGMVSHTGVLPTPPLVAPASQTTPPFHILEILGTSTRAGRSPEIPLRMYRRLAQLTGKVRTARP